MKRLTNKRLEFYETNTAACSGIISKSKFLAHHINDPDLLRLIKEIADSANRMRIRNIKEMKKEKEYG